MWYENESDGVGETAMGSWGHNCLWSSPATYSFLHIGFTGQGGCVDIDAIACMANSLFTEHIIIVYEHSPYDLLTGVHFSDDELYDQFEV